MPRDVGYLVAVVGRAGGRYVARVLVSVLHTCRDGKVARWSGGSLCLHIDTRDVYPSEVKHGPTELLTLWISHYLVMHSVVIAVCL